jgi:hypothetical protein
MRHDQSGWRLDSRRCRHIWPPRPSRCLFFLLHFCFVLSSHPFARLLGWNNEAFLNKGSSNSLTSHWHMSSDFMNSLAENGEYRANCFQSTNNYERLWKGVRNYRWTQVSSSSSSSSLDGVTAFPTSWAGHHWGLTSGNNERDAVITSHSDNQWACAGNAGPNGEGALSVVFYFASYFDCVLVSPGYTGRGGHSNMRICKFLSQHCSAWIDSTSFA